MPSKATLVGRCLHSTNALRPLILALMSSNTRLSNELREPWLAQDGLETESSMWGNCATAAFIVQDRNTRNARVPFRECRFLASRIWISEPVRLKFVGTRLVMSQPRVARAAILGDARRAMTATGHRRKQKVVKTVAQHAHCCWSSTLPLSFLQDC